MESHLTELQKNFQILGIKSETEAEGSSFEEIWNLRSVTNKFNLPLHLKIGGCEAINDIVKAYEIGVDCIIAPMIETDFACYKFLESVKKVYGTKNINLAINIETQTALKNLESILNMAKGKIRNITIGRSDLSSSFFDKKITQDSEIITSAVKNIIKSVMKM